MKNIFTLISVAALSLFLTSCGQSYSSSKNPVVAKVNNFKMTVSDLKDNLGANPAYNALKINEPGLKRQIVDDIIRKEVLLQEAQKRDLDKEKTFMRTIERYWEQALIKNLLEKKSQEIAGSIQVSPQEIQNYYQALKTNDPEAPELEKIKDEIKQTLLRQKESQSLDAWVDSLVKGAKITVNEEALDKTDFSK